MPLSKDKIKNDFSRAAANYEQHANLQRKVAEKLAKFGWEIFDPKGQIIDVGSGTGFVKKLLKPANVTQLDISEKMCNQSFPLAPTICADMDQMPIADESMDGIISSLTMQWAIDTKKTFKEFARVLKSGSPFIISTFGIHTLQELKSIFRMIDPFTHINLFLEPDEMAAIAREAGFKNIEIRTELEIEEYSDVMQLMQTIKRIGASNKQDTRKKGLSSREYFSKINKLYHDNFGRSTYIPATWEVLYIKGIKL
jgi:malonyl-CoA O-methyltransferase